MRTHLPLRSATTSQAPCWEIALQLLLQFDNLLPQEAACFPARPLELSVATPKAFQHDTVAQRWEVRGHGAGRYFALSIRIELWGVGSGRAEAPGVRTPGAFLLRRIRATRHLPGHPAGKLGASDRPDDDGWSNVARTFEHSERFSFRPNPIDVTSPHILGTARRP